jgi:predicted O-methyltransferase YrrM
MLITQDLTKNLGDSLRTLYSHIPITPYTCVEIGSFEGLGSILIDKYLCNHPDSKLYCIDPFDDEYVKGSETLSFWNSACEGQKERFYHNTKLHTKIIPMQGYSDEMIQKLDNNTIDFAYIDGDHSPEQVYKDAVNIFPKMKDNSIILFDDYLWNINNIRTRDGIDKFLNEYSGKYNLLLKNYQIAIQITLTPATFNVLIATVGRPTLQTMLNSLSPQLNKHDCLTVVFDGHTTPPIFDYSRFKCKVNIHCERTALGWWGHGIRNKYATLLEKRDFVMHADDDDTYFPDAFSQLRTVCTDTATWYVAKMKFGGSCIPVNKGIWLGNIGTPCGIMSYELNKQSSWDLVYGGDCEFYLQLQAICNPVFLDILIYKVIR